MEDIFPSAVCNIKRWDHYKVIGFWWSYQLLISSLNGLWGEGGNCKMQAGWRMQMAGLRASGGCVLFQASLSPSASSLPWNEQIHLHPSMISLVCQPSNTEPCDCRWKPSKLWPKITLVLALAFSGDFHSLEQLTHTSCFLACVLIIPFLTFWL